MISESKIREFKEKYKSGTVIELINMEDEQKIPNGTRGVVDFVDDMRTIHIIWENGPTLGLIPDVDSFKIVDKKKLNDEFKI